MGAAADGVEVGAERARGATLRYIVVYRRERRPRPPDATTETTKGRGAPEPEK